MPAKSIDADAIVREIEESGVIIRGYRSRHQLIASIQRALDEGKSCAFVPTLKTLREFLNTNGFVLVMDEVESQLTGHDVLIEPNVYNSRHIFAVGPQRQ